MTQNYEILEHQPFFVTWGYGSTGKPCILMKVLHESLQYYLKTIQKNKTTAQKQKQIVKQQFVNVQISRL